MTKTTEQNTPQWVRMDDLIDDGWEVVGTLDKNSTDEDIEALAREMAWRTMPPEDSPIWNALAEAVLALFTPRETAAIMTYESEFKEYEKKLPEYIADGGTEDEYWESVCLEIEREWSENE